MELFLKSDSASALEMKNAHNMMLKIFKERIMLENHYGPVQMGVWRLEYSYLPEKYKIFIETERGFITISVKNDKDKIFAPRLIYKEADYYHFADKEEDVFQLVSLTHKAIVDNKIKFFTKEEIIKINTDKR